MGEVFGRYQLIRKLAAGGMAEVYLARLGGMEGFEKLVVLKRILPHLSESEEFVKMFLQEARTSARLSHPNIAQVFDLGEVASSYFLAMEYVHGEDVRRTVRQAASVGRTLPVPLAVRIIADAAAGLDYAHNRSDEKGRALQIVHRDISPQNILVTFTGQVKVIDFGIAKAADASVHTRSGVLKGKYSYMSPEQASAKKVDRRSDVFALGIVMYELVTGARLFKRATDLSTIHAVMACKFEPPSKKNAAVDAELDAILLRALAKDMNERTPTAAQLQMELEEYLTLKQSPASAAHLAKFMKEIYAERLSAEEKAGGPVFEPSEPGGATVAGRSRRKAVSVGGAAAAAGAIGVPGLESTPSAEKTPIAPPPQLGSAAVSAAAHSGDTLPGPATAVVAGPAQEITTVSALSSILRGLKTRRGMSIAAAALLVAIGLVVVLLLVRSGGAAAGRASPPAADVWVNTVPEGAQVYLDGNAQAGRAPLKLEIAMGLQHDLRVEADGHAPQTRAVRYANAGPHTETFTLLPIQKGMGVVKIVSDPPGAKVFLDGRELAERTPTMVGQVIAGEDHVLLTSLAGYEDARQTVRVKEREVQEVSFKLAAIPGAAPAPTPAPPVSPGVKPAPTAALAATPALGPGQLTVRTRPSVLLSVDGRALGRTPIEKLDLPPGRHELRFQDEDSFLDQKVFVEVAPGKESVDDRAFAKRRVRFAPQPWANVYVKDRFLLTAPGDKDLYPGTYSVTFVNDKIKARKTIQIIVPDAGADLATMTVKLTPGEGWDGG